MMNCNAAAYIQAFRFGFFNQLDWFCSWNCRNVIFPGVFSRNKFLEICSSSARFGIPSSLIGLKHSFVNNSISFYFSSWGNAITNPSKSCTYCKAILANWHWLTFVIISKSNGSLFHIKQFCHVIPFTAFVKAL
jgi:hypothetical protein